MKNVKVLDVNYYNRKIVLPVIGVTDIDKEGFLTVADDKLEEFLQSSSKFVLVAVDEDEKSDEIAPQNEESEELNKSEEDELQPQVEENEKLAANEMNEISLLLNNKTVKELKELASPFDESEWGKLKKEDLKNYLLEKLA